MKISTKGRYALRLMLDLAVYGGGHVVSLGDVARRQDISVKYLEQLCPALSRAGLIQSVRGAGGGYLLARDPDDITVGEILRAQEGSLAPVGCAEAEGRCPREERCVTAGLWRRVKEAVDSVVDAATLGELAREQSEKDGKA